MDAELSPEQDEIRRTLRDLLAKHCTSDALRAAADSPAGHDPELWSRLTALGLPGLLQPAELGGLDLTPVDLAVVAEETGRALLPAPLLGGWLAASALTEAAAPALTAPALTTPAVTVPASAEAASARARLASGAATGALCLAETVAALPAAPASAGGGRAGGLQARPAPEGPEGGWLLYGEAPTVLDGAAADLLVVTAHTGGYPRSRSVLLLVDGGAPGVRRTRLPALDDTRSLARVEFRDAPAALLADPAPDPAAGTAALAAVAVAAQAVGAARESLGRAVEHARTREQFGRPIGANQALAHALADVHVAVQSARATVLHAAWSLSVAEPDPTDPALALAAALDAQTLAAGTAIQVHGGLGITWEHDAQLFYKRAAADELLFGPAHALRARAADAAGLLADL
ncbi:acyl-CoA dehydrogenase family protein [Phaeacidiphilus oryzae]|uniref:acyl-CoA dehydrogenase family protein n=1 Tax=Phaeacidiphilus oryzae TaxID=348818 RepID=UPI0005668F4C|nr:acyl-CoA dehydrogenase family protein [Phaeacidiphilus oryzae]